MKRYLVSVGDAVNERASKTGIKFRFYLRTDNPEVFIEKNVGRFEYGFRIKDSQTGEIIYKEVNKHGT